MPIQGESLCAAVRAEDVAGKKRPTAAGQDMELTGNSDLKRYEKEADKEGVVSDMMGTKQ